MKVSIPICFEVVVDDEDELDEKVAKAAAEQAAFDFLTFCTVSGVNTDTDEVEVHVDGFGPCRVRLSEE